MDTLEDIKIKLSKIGERDGEDDDTINGVLLLVEHDSLEKTVSEYIEKNPNATLQHILGFLMEGIPPIEIVDD